MAMFLKMGDIEGEATDDMHQAWILGESLLTTIDHGTRNGAGSKRHPPSTELILTRQLDRSSVALMAACATSRSFPEVDIHFCTQIRSVQEPYLKCKLRDVSLSRYKFTGNSAGSPLPSEELDLSFGSAVWTYVVVDPATGEFVEEITDSYGLKSKKLTKRRTAAQRRR